MRMANTLMVYRKQIIEPFRDSPRAFIEMPPTSHLLEDDINLYLDDLYFLLETEDRNLIGELMVERNRFRSALDAINERSRIHRNEVQPKLEQAGFAEGVNYSFDEIETFLGQRLYSTMKQSTSQLIIHVDQTIERLQKVSNKLTDALKSQYPNETIIKFGAET